MKAIIFGINGQDGYYLNELLKQEGIDVIGVSRREGDWIVGDVGNLVLVEQLIQKHQPKFIFHLAANSTTWHDVIYENHNSIVTGTINILDSVLKYSKTSKVFISGSGLQFKNTGKPINESAPFEGNDAYSVSRIQSVYTARYYKTLGLKVYIGYFFNHDSPLRTERHVNQKIIAGLKRIVRGSKEKIQLRNIEVEKEFTFAGDTVAAIWLLVNNDIDYELVIGSGKAYSIKDWLIICFNYYNLDWEKHVEISAEFKSDYSILVSDPTKLLRLGWKQTENFEGLAKMMIEHEH
ncbi:MAG: epimerase [Flavobacteriales bacterium]|nr:MAG: epimerase [Flavobacteriales bacterium]